MDIEQQSLRILALTTSYPTSETDYRGRFIHEWAQSLFAHNATVRVIGPRAPSILPGVPYEGFRHYPGLLMENGAPDTLQERKIWGTVIGAAVTVDMARLARARSNAGELIVAHWLMPSAFAAFSVQRQKGCRVHAYAHGSDVALLEAMPSMVSRRLTRVLDRQLNGISFVSNQLKERFNRLLGRASSTPQYVVPMGLHRANPCEDFAQEIRKRAQGKTVMCTIGRLVPIKGLDTLAQAIAREPKYLWVAAGHGPEAQTLRTWLPDENRLFLPGILSPPQREALLRESHVFIQPSRVLGYRQEGTPVAVLEAMAAGVPTILSATGGLTVIGESAGSILIPPDDPHMLKSAIEELMASPERRRAISQNHSEYGEQYVWSNLSRQHIQMLKKSASDS